MVLLAYYALTMAPSIRTKVSNSFVPTTKSSENTLLETQEQNGVAERYNRTVVETARSLLIVKTAKVLLAKSCRHSSLLTESCQKGQNRQKPLPKILGSKTKNRTFEKFWMSR